MQRILIPIFVALVLAAAIGSTGFYLMSTNCMFDGCTAMVKTTTLSSAYLYSGVTAYGSGQATANLVMTFNNPGPTTYISSLSLSGGYEPQVGSNANVTPRLITTTSTSTTSTSGLLITSWQNSSSSSTIDFQIYSANNKLASEKVSFFDFYARTTSPVTLTDGYVYSYAVYFTNGDSISGSLIAQ